jgi:hypothetical protein
MAHGAAHDPAQHIAAPSLDGSTPSAIRNEAGAQMVGDHPVAALCLARPQERRSRHLPRPRSAGATDRCRNCRACPATAPMRSSPMPVSIDGRGRSTRSSVVELLELHEDQVPDLDEPVAVLIRRTGRPPQIWIAVIVEDLGTGAARPGIAHRPEIVVGRDPDDLFVGQAGDLAPDRRLVIGVIDRDQQLRLVDAEILGQQVPGKGIARSLK